MKRAAALIIIGIAVFSFVYISPLMLRQAMAEYYIYENTDNGILCLETETGELSGSVSGDVIIPAMIQGHQVRSIAYKGFFKCTGLTSISIPEGVTGIGDNAFKWDSQLTSISMPNSLTSIGYSAFEMCSSLKEVNLPPNLTSLGYGAFGGCISLSSISIPDGVTCIDHTTFWNCGGLTSVSIGAGVTFIGDNAFVDCDKLSSISIPSGVEYIGSYAFCNCDLLASVDIASGVKFIGDGAFQGCNSLVSISIPTSVISIGGCAFSGCNSLVSISIPTSVTSIGGFAFQGCNSLASISIPASVTYLGSNVFYNCTSLSSVLFACSASPENMGTNIFTGCTSLRAVNIGSKVTIIPVTNRYNSLLAINVAEDNPLYADINGILFNKAITQLLLYPSGRSGSSYSIPDTVTGIEIEAFYCCSNLTEINIPISVTYIGDDAFYGCSALTSVNIPYGVTDIGSAAFSNCSNLATAHFYGNAPSMGYKVFSNTSSGFIIYCPAWGTGFTTPLWNGYATKMFSFIDSSSFNIGNNTGTDTLTGPQVSLAGKNFNLFALPLGLDISFFDTVKVSYDSETKKYTVMIGDVDDDAKELTNLMKAIANEGLTANRYRQLRRIVKPTKLGAGLDSDSYSCGYMEFINVDGEPVFSEGGFIVAAQFDKYIVYPTSVPLLYLKFGIEGEGNGKLQLVVQEVEIYHSSINAQGELEFILAPYLGVGAGLEKLAHVEAGIKGELDASLVIPIVSLPESFEVKLTGYVYLTYQALLFIDGEYTKKFTEYTLYPPQEGTESIQTLSIDADDLQLMPRDYLISANQERLGMMNTDSNMTTIKSGVYPYGEPQLLSLENGRQLLIWIDDDTSRSLANRTSLMYSVFDCSAWSDPQYVNDDETADFSPRTVVSGDNVYLVWQNASHVFDDTVTLEEMAQSIDIYYAKFSGNSFTDFTNLASGANTVYEMTPLVSTNGSEVSVGWTENSLNDIFCFSGTNSIIRRTLNNGSWGEAQVLDSGLPFITGIDSSYNNNCNLVAYCIDTDGDAETMNDTEIFLIYGTEKSQVTDDVVDDSAVQFVQLGDMSSLYWESNGQIHYVSLDDITLINTVDIATGTSQMRNIHILNNPNNNQVIVWEQADGFNSDLYAAYFDQASSTWGEAIRLTSLENKIRQSAGYLDDSNNIRMAFDLVQVQELSDAVDNPYGCTDLMVMNIGKECNLSIIEPVYYDNDQVSAGNTVNLYVNIKNNGADPVDQIDFELMDKNNTVLKTQTLAATIASGATEELVVPYTLPSNLSKNDLTVKINPVGQSDLDLSDNTAVFTMGFADLSIQSITTTGETEAKQLQVKIQNTGYDDAENITVFLYKNNADGQLLDTKNIEVLTAGNYETISFEIPSGLLFTNNLEKNKLFYINVKSDSAEELYANNSDIVAVACASAISLTVSAGDGSAALNWTAYANTVSYQIYQSTTPGNYNNTFDTVTASVCSYNVTGLTNDTTYYFLIKAIDAEENCFSSNEVSVEPSATVDECFIATAAFGSKFQPAVVILRQFRDKFLLANSLGRSFVNFYYNNSPTVARYIAGNELLKAIVRILLLPLVIIACIFLNPTPVIILILVLLLIIRHRQKLIL